MADADPNQHYTSELPQLNPQRMPGMHSLG